MPTSQNNKLSQELSSSLKSATSLMNDLLGDIKDNATSLAMLKVKLESLSDSVESLSHIVRDGNGKGSMVTRIALTEQSLEHIEESFDEFKAEMSRVIREVKCEVEKERLSEKEVMDKEQEHKREKLMTKLKILAVIAPGAIALAIAVVKMIMGES